MLHSVVLNVAMIAAAGTTMSPKSSADKFEARLRDWRNGAVVYQVFVDRFAPSSNLSAKKDLYAAPARLRDWKEVPKATAYDPAIKTYPHVLEFWGGDLASLTGKLDHITTLADVLYLLPIFKSPSNHKYDTEDYFQVDPQYGSNKDLDDLISRVHKEGMKIMLDGVFNHIGATSPLFKQAQADPKSKRRDWFYFGSEYPEGYRGWAGVPSLPALKLETKAVPDYLWEKKDSVVRHYLDRGIDGWRLDVAFELGPKLLRNLTKSAHSAKSGSAVVGEIAGYPGNWFDSVDGVFNFSAIHLGIKMTEGKVTGGQAGRNLSHMVADAGIDNLLKSWILYENHDTPRLATTVPNQANRALVVGMQMTLPGSPCIYYGQELGMTGAGDPSNRAPMRWDLVNEKNKDLAWMRKLLAIRRERPALRVGDFTALDSEFLLAFARTTNKLAETTIVLINPTDEPVREVFTNRVGRIMSWGELEDQLTGAKFRSIAGLIDIEVKPKSMMILAPTKMPNGGYSPYDRIDG